MSARRYDLLAIDLDGTLIGPEGAIRTANIEAIDRARADGLEIVVCTGRGLIESGAHLSAIDARTPAHGRDVAPVVCAGGAMIANAVDDSTMHRWAMREDLVRRLCAHFAEHRRAPLLLKDRGAAGYDYLVVDSGPIEEPSKWWFKHMGVEVRFVDSLDDDEHPEHTIRVGFAAHESVMGVLGNSIIQTFGREAHTQHFAAVSGSKDGSGGVKDEAIHLLEVFDPQVNKWTAIHRLAMEQGIDRARIAAIGDEINDLQMIEGAALGVAMGNAVERIKAVADVHAPGFDEDGVAHAIDRILEGAW
ncbi:MAG: Cof-type HAD-IIB family hydrolase [Phycisphaerales bacterium]